MPAFYQFETKPPLKKLRVVVAVLTGGKPTALACIERHYGKDSLMYVKEVKPERDPKVAFLVFDELSDSPP